MNTAAPVRTDSRFTVEEYLAFIATRPSEERWQLIDGVAMMMPPPTLRHQSIAGNLVFELSLHFRTRRLGFRALQEVGLIVPGVERFRPECDVAVLDDAMDLDTSYAERFYLAAEVLSDSNTETDVELKRQRYLQHPDNLYCLIISQTEVSVEVWARAKGWQPFTLRSLDDVLELPELGFAAPIASLYLGTPLGR